SSRSRLGAPSPGPLGADTRGGGISSAAAVSGSPRDRTHTARRAERESRFEGGSGRRRPETLDPPGFSPRRAYSLKRITPKPGGEVNDVGVNGRLTRTANGDMVVSNNNGSRDTNDGFPADRARPRRPRLARGGCRSCTCLSVSGARPHLLPRRVSDAV